MTDLSLANEGRFGGVRARIGSVSRVLLSLVGIVAPSVAAGADSNEITPDPAIQRAICDAANATDEQRRAAIDQVINIGRASPEQFVRQVVYFGSRAVGTRAAMVGGVILRRMDLPDETIARALVPCLEFDDDAVVKLVRSTLGGLEKRSPGRRPDFSVYRGIIEDHVRARVPLPDGLIRYLYDADAGMAMLILMRAHQLRKPEEIKPILWVEHLVSDVVWKQQHGFLKSREVEPAAAAELAGLLRHPAWWARLYVAEVMRQYASFRDTAFLSALSEDSNRLVRESARAARSAR